jgi:hypothetical protein
MDDVLWFVVLGDHVTEDPLEAKPKAFDETLREVVLLEHQGAYAGEVGVRSEEFFNHPLPCLVDELGPPGPSCGGDVEVPIVRGGALEDNHADQWCGMSVIGLVIFVNHSPGGDHREHSLGVLLKLLPSVRARVSLSQTLIRLCPSIHPFDLSQRERRDQVNVLCF